ncbi:O-antigen ligase family protein [Petroclostridium sp. X23]|uniref:O-antigen ligase family protein n=1 Tax=Petroclostridium sp. X23 TaxID=3045146 RepID=UPI0024AD2288|nr:O-antigen ligase family protein [Petroclostridium sp. X23]WHH59333.1 O-antigen ligase family protein [Petroclostridium sp. X23]
MYGMIMSAFVIVFSPYLALIPIAFIGLCMVLRSQFLIYNTWNIGLFFLFVWSFLVGLLNTSIVSATVSFAVLLYFLLSLYLQNHYTDEQKIEQLLKVFLLVSVISALIGVVEGYTSIQYQPSWWKHLFGIYPLVAFREKYRISGTFGNPNVAAIWYVVMIFVCYYFFNRSNGYLKILYALAGGLFGGVLLLTGSRGAVIGLLLGLIIYAYFMGHKKKMCIVMGILTLGTILMFAFPEHFPRGHDFFESLRDRRSIWVNCLRLFKVKPVTGWGLLGIYYADPRIYHYFRNFHAHNIWITMAATVGIVGLGIFTYMQFDLFAKIKRLSTCRCQLVPLLAAVQAAVLGQGFLDFTIMNPQVGILFIGSSALVYSLAAQYEDIPVKRYFPLYNMQHKV